ncbi:ribonuclease H-like domain-containing protein, partial [Tanacetum coccineum]
KGNPLHLHPNDSNCASIVSLKLIRVKNYRIWASDMKLALQIKHKMGFVNGTCVSSLSQDVYLGHVFSNNAETVWKELQETYDRIDRLNSVWRKFDILTKLPDCTCAARIELSGHAKLLKLMQFLMGLDDIYQPIRSSILTREILPEVKDDFVIISREESHRGIPSSSVKTDKPRVSTFASRQNDNNRNKKIIAINLDTSSDSDNNTSDSASTSQISTSEEIYYDSLEYKGPPKSLLKWYGYLSDEYKDKDMVANAKTWDAILSKTFGVKISPTMTCAEEKKGKRKISSKDFSKEYLSWNYFPSIDKDVTDQDSTDEDCIHKSNSAMSKGKYVPVSHKHNLEVKSPVPVIGCVLGLAIVYTWDDILKKFGVRKPKSCADKAKGKRNVSYGT